MTHPTEQSAGTPFPDYPGKLPPRRFWRQLAQWWDEQQPIKEIKAIDDGGMVVNQTTPGHYALGLEDQS